MLEESTLTFHVKTVSLHVYLLRCPHSRPSEIFRRTDIKPFLVHSANAGGITACKARGRGFESRLCRQRWQSSSEDRARNNFSTSSCRNAPYGRMPAGLHWINNRRTNNTKQESCHNLAAHPFPVRQTDAGGITFHVRGSRVRVPPCRQQTSMAG